MGMTEKKNENLTASTHVLLNFHSSFQSYPFGIACLIILLISVTQNPFTVYVEPVVPIQNQNLVAMIMQ